jgi:hypothetical protein
MECTLALFEGKLHLRMSGTFDPVRPVEVTISFNAPSRLLDLAGPITLARVSSSVLEWSTGLVDCASWSLVLYGFRWSLQSLVPYSPVFLVVRQGAREYARIKVQRRAYCVHLDH